MSRPTDDPFTWATAAGAAVTEPTSQRKANGWIAGLVPPADYWNWLLRHLGQWVTYLASAPTVYATLEDAYADLDPGDLAIIDEGDSSLGASPGDVDTSGLSSGVNVAAVCITGKSVIYSTGTDLVELNRDDFTTVIRTYTKTVSGSIVRLISDGNLVYLLCGRRAEAMRLSDGVSVWTKDFGATLTMSDMALTRNRLLFGGNDTGAAANVYCLNAEDGTTYWTFNHGAQIRSVAASGTRGFMAGTASSYASGATLRCVLLDSGAAVTNEGGASVDTTGTAWNVVQPDIQIIRATLATDGRSLFTGLPSTAANQLVMRGCADGVVVASKVITGFGVKGLSVDQGLVLCCLSTGALGQALALSRHNLAAVWRWVDPTYDHTGIASDGAGVFVGRSPGAAVAALFRRRRGNRPTVFRRTDYTVDNDFAPFPSALTPSME